MTHPAIKIQMAVIQCSHPKKNAPRGYTGFVFSGGPSTTVFLWRPHVDTNKPLTSSFIIYRALPCDLCIPTSCQRGKMSQRGEVATRTMDNTGLFPKRLQQTNVVSHRSRTSTYGSLHSILPPFHPLPMTTRLRSHRSSWTACEWMGAEWTLSIKCHSTQTGFQGRGGNSPNQCVSRQMPLWGEKSGKEHKNTHGDTYTHTHITMAESKVFC